MKTETQLDIFNDSPQAQAAAFRKAAEAARHDWHYTQSEREQRAAYYEKQAAALEAQAGGA